MKKTFKLADEVVARIAQILQEGMLMGTDVTDGFRMIRLEEDDTNPGALVMTQEYRSLVSEQHRRALDHIEAWRKQQEDVEEDVSDDDSDVS